MTIKWYELLTSKIKTFFLYIQPLLFYNSSKQLNLFCRTLYIYRLEREREREIPFNLRKRVSQFCQITVTLIVK
jgi:hypothetical protein